MCGIAGFAGDFPLGSLYEANALQRHRGPDASAVFYEDNIGLAHTRLSIIDLSPLGSQPYSFDHLVMVYNGELYNYRDVRDELMRKSYLFDSKSDTEVIIKAFHCWGLNAIEKFLGMFAIAIYDRKAKRMYLVRDRLGVKPLYYSTINGLSFASELKAAKSFIKQQPTIDTDATREYFRTGYISGSRTIYQEVRKLEAGHYLIWENNRIHIHAYWQLTQNETVSSKSAATRQEAIHMQMAESFKLRMIADVPVGVFLSGGTDSSLVTAILQKQYGNIHTFTIGFDDAKFNEAPYAEKVARHLQTNHTAFTISVKDALPVLKDFYKIYDEPFADTSGIPTAIVSGLAKNAGVKVVLSADGGDELFGGYSHYRSTERLFLQIQKLPGRFSVAAGELCQKLFSAGIFRSLYRGNAEHRVAALGELLKEKDFLSFYRGLLANQSNQEIDELLSDHRKPTIYKQIAGIDQMSLMMLWDLNYYLPDNLLVKTDRATMYHSIEGREPFLDHRLVEAAFGLPLCDKIQGTGSKVMLKQILSGYLPKELVERPKQGFSIPMFKWFSTQMDELFQFYFTYERIEKVFVLNARAVLHEYSKYTYYKKHGLQYNIEKMWRILSFIMWWNSHYCNVEN